jgi:N-hydroxyarylamine O-acetyltransferase
MKINDYLARFEGREYKAVTLFNLENLQRLHMLQVPFENLDVIRKVPIYLNLQTIYKKIVTQRRGGYCYELNGLFNWLLTELGYDAHLIAATVRRPNGEWAKADTHAAILTQLDEPYLVDVGFGDATYLPIPLNGEEQTDSSGTYRVIQQTVSTFDLERKNDAGIRTLYRFSTNPKALTDFHEGCVFNQVAKESSFTHTDIVTRATPSGRITLSDQTLTVTENNSQIKTSLSIEEKEHLLVNKFGIRL